ncbi:hypothetical protein GUJ93_ZPchr0009g1121 [Zizania palustris]|uniref:Uncharacterized protein n=1 Tax=Zizania palustris TaxID=103762 RepID=A0A8J5RWV6_ZIZPA|nr:hypothetical protein GUJ93_ZPchr0009g1121 [Zizania palustris]
MSSKITPNLFPMSFEDSSNSDSERTLTDIPPVVINADSEDDEVTSNRYAMVLVEAPHILCNEALEVGAPSTRQQEVEIPDRLKTHNSYIDGDWKAFHE